MRNLFNQLIGAVFAEMPGDIVIMTLGVLAGFYLKMLFMS